MRDRYTVELDDSDAARWLAEQARDLFVRTRDYGWKEIADNLDRQLRGTSASLSDGVAS